MPARLCCKQYGNEGVVNHVCTCQHRRTYHVSGHGIIWMCKLWKGVHFCSPCRFLTSPYYSSCHRCHIGFSLNDMIIMASFTGTNWFSDLQAHLSLYWHTF